MSAPDSKVPSQNLLSMLSRSKAITPPKTEKVTEDDSGTIVQFNEPPVVRIHEAKPTAPAEVSKPANVNVETPTDTTPRKPRGQGRAATPKRSSSYKKREKPRAKSRVSIVKLMEEPDWTPKLKIRPFEAPNIEKDQRDRDALAKLAEAKGFNVQIQIKSDKRKQRIKRTPFNISLSDETIAQLEEFASANQMKNREAVEFLLDLVLALENNYLEKKSSKSSS